MKPYYQRGPVTLLCADVREGLASLPDESVQCIVTSPPYWGLRDYGVPGQIGLEPTLAEYISGMVDVFGACRRVLRRDGTLWLNVGDTYHNPQTNGGVGRNSTINSTRTHAAFREGQRAARIGRNPKAGQEHADVAEAPQRVRQAGLKPKDLCGVPWRLALALQDDGWYLRSDIVWHKPNSMPESVKDRPTKAHEYVFLLARGPRYFYDAAAISERATYREPNAPDKIRSPHGQGFTRRARRGKNEHSGHQRYAGFNDRWAQRETRAMARNARSVWSIATQPRRENHFAAFPDELAGRCIRAGSPWGGAVFDPFAGRGTTLIVAAQLGRSAIGIELSPKYCSFAAIALDDVLLPLIDGAAEASR